MRLRLQAFSSFTGAVLFKLRLSASEWRFALTSFAAKVALFWLLELAFCKWAPERQICHLVEKGFVPCLITYTVMDFLVIRPALQRQITRAKPTTSASKSLQRS